jgi:hypothetical protein
LNSITAIQGKILAQDTRPSCCVHRIKGEYPTWKMN